MDSLRAAGIQSSIHYPPVHLFSYPDAHPEIALPKSEEFCAAGLGLPLHPALEAADVERVVDCLGTALRRKVLSVGNRLTSDDSDEQTMSGK